MDEKIRFFFYLVAIIVWVLAALGNSFKVGGRSMSLIPLGLAIFWFPTLWDAGEAAF